MLREAGVIIRNAPPPPSAKCSRCGILYGDMKDKNRLEVLHKKAVEGMVRCDNCSCYVYNYHDNCPYCDEDVLGRKY
jgi:hypothetical protein